MSSEQAYRDHEDVANSDLKGLKAQTVGSPMPENLDRIFEFGTLSHHLILEPEKANYLDEDIEKALEMKDTFFKDDFCRRFREHPGFVAEQEFHRKGLMGINAKCRMDGAIASREDILEFKSLAITTESAFEEAIYHFDYEMGAAWYLDVSQYKRLLIVAISKKKTDRLFKMVIDRDHDAYKSGLAKYTEWTSKWKELLL